MALTRPRFSIGIEEEYLLVDPATRNLLSDPHPSIFEACTRSLGDRVSPEFLRAQIEVGKHWEDQGYEGFDGVA